jgi:hypothetical protein
MTCENCFQQVRLGELLTFEWQDKTEVEMPLDLGSAIDLAGSNVVAVTINVSSATLGTNVSSVDFVFRTAPINNDAFYADVLGSTGDPTAISVTAAGVKFDTTSGFSRFFALQPVLVETGASGTTKVVATIDVIIRG